MAASSEGVKLPLRRKRKNGEENDSVAGKRLESCLDQPTDSVICEVVTYTASPLPDKHYDADTTEPITCGLKSTDELLSWTRSKANPFSVAVVPLAPREPPLDRCLRRTLVSHDMMGGYLDDRFVQGTNAEAPYAFYHWQYIDVFNYFSHHLVTIPPAVWTNAAHKHGVTVIGTFITEWTDGAAMCEDLLKDEESYRRVADKLVQISHCYGFDGWLINIENALSEVAVRNVPLFLRYLTDQMHERVSGSLVLWYDSVIDNGELKWQNELNQSNRMFFDACDGFFTNYNWKEENLMRMKTLAVQDRQADIYVGVDVFARGEVVGGMFETNKALEIIRRHNFSVAIFAPGWVYETHEDKSEFRKNQDKFWALLSNYLYIHRLASSLPFVSSFCQGFGNAVYWQGQASGHSYNDEDVHILDREEHWFERGVKEAIYVKRERPSLNRGGGLRHETERSWFNLTAQEIQPLYYHRALGDLGWLRSSGCPKDAWNGSCSLLLEGLIPASHTTPVCAKIFSIHVPLASSTLVSLIYKAPLGIAVSLELKTTDASQCTHIDVQEVQLSSVSPEVLDDDHQLVNKFTQLCGNLNQNGWTMRCSQLELHGCTLREVCVKIERIGRPKDTPFSCRVGELMVLDATRLQVPPDRIQGVCIDDVVWLRGAGTSPESTPYLLLNATLRWDYPGNLVRHFKVYWRQLRGPHPSIPPGHLVLVGRSYSNLFRVTELRVPEPPGLLELVVEPVIKMGFPVPESHWGRRSLSYTKDFTK